MSDQDLPFGTPSGAVGVADQPQDEVVEETQEQGRRPMLLVIGGAVVLALGVLAYLLLFHGSSSEDLSGAVAPPVAQPSAAAPGNAQPSAKPSAKTVPPTFDGSVGRDPFQPLVVPSPAPSASAAPSSSTGTSGSTGSTTLTPSTGAPVVFSVTSVSSKSGTAATTVNGKAYTAKLGEVFATNFKLVAVGLNSNCGTFQYGDATVQMCKGDTATLAG